jgi:conjugal transfer pilus assembly protein TraB
MLSPSQTRKKQLRLGVGAIVGFVGLLIFGMWLSDPHAGQPTPIEVAAARANEVKKNFTAQASAVVTPEEAWISSGEKQIAELRADNADLKKKLDDVLKALQQRDEKLSLAPSSSPVMNAPPGMSASSSRGAREVSMAQLEEAIVPPPAVRTPLLPPPLAQGSPNAAQVNVQNEGTIEVVSLSEEAATGKGRSTKRKRVNSYLPTGAFATAVLLSGVDAPTGGQAKSNPVPVLLRLMDEGQLPNFFNSDIDDCHVLGAAYGDISSERANVRLETLTCVLVNGDIIEEPIAGYVAGEDGKAGLRGRLVEKQGAMIARSLLAGVASGMGSSLSQQYQQVSTSALGSVTTVDPNKVMQNGLATGAGNALEKIADYYIARANEMYPIIEVDANRIGEVILTGGTDLKQSVIGNKRERKP